MTQGLNRTVPAPEPRGATLHLTLDAAEHHRRTECAAAAVTDPTSLDLLLALPVGIAVATRALSWHQQQAVRRLPRGSVDVTRTHVTRLAVRPCRIDLATVSGPPTGRSLGRASWFAPFCSRALIIPRAPRRRDFLAEADFWGIGVTLDHDGEQEVLVEPEPWVLRRHTPAGWRYVERAYKVAAVASAQEAA